ncbi:MAG: discoidin domain-containing protein [Coprobacillus sp.]
MKMKRLVKRISLITLSLLMMFGMITTQNVRVNAATTGQDAINIIKQRLKDYFLELDTIDDGSKVETCYVSKASDYLALIKEDGSFGDVDYNAHNNAANGSAWSPYLAIDRLQAIAIAYNKEGNALYHKDEAKDGVDKALKYWVTQGSRTDKPGGPYSLNWWENEVGVQLRFSRIGLFMEGVISAEGFKVITDKLIEKTPVKEGTGQNNLWFDQNHVYYALITNNPTKLKEMITNYLNHCLAIQKDDNTKEAVQVDNSFYMHGKQFYSNGYGMSMFRDMSFWIYMLRDTEFSISQEVVDRMADYMLEGTRWTIRGDLQELYLGYRPYKYSVDYKNYAEEYIEPLKRMKAVDSTHAADYQKVLDNILGNTKDNGRDGNYYMWRSGYASHMRKNYGVNIKMDSSELKGGEWRGSWPNGNNKGQLIYWTSAAASTIAVDGDEYTPVYPVFNWKHTPGTTAPNALSGRYTMENGELFNIGVTNGNYGATAYKFDKMSTQGQKGYFFFDDEFVALGTNIKSTNGTAIHTTLNQSKASEVKVNGQAVGDTTGTKYTAKTIYNDDIGYVFLNDTEVNVSNTLQKDVPSLWPDDMKKAAPSVFTAWIDHGVKPTDASYSYVVVPGKTSSQVEQYSKNIPIAVVANNKDVQAVRHDGLKQTQINFYSAGELEYKPGYKVSVNEPCSLIIDESGQTRVITVAVRDQDAGKEMDINLSYNGQTTKTQLVTKGTPYAGQSITVNEGESFKNKASSYTEGHAPTNVVDGNKNSYWESQTNGNEWLSTYVDSNALVKNVKITWGNNYATKYDVYVSKDGVNYSKVKSITDGTGGESVIELNGIYQYVKVDMLGSNNANYQIKEIEFEKYQNLSRNQPVTASSENITEDSKVGPIKHMTDGNMSTRWKSKTNSNDEWVIIDLEKYSKMSNVSIKWETACSSNYEIWVSQDAKRWQKVKGNLVPNQSLNDSIELTNAYGRYIKVHSTATKTLKWGISIFEIDVYGEEAIEPPIEISYLQNAFASSSTGTANKVTDGNETTYWKSDTNENEWIYLELKDIYDIKDMTIKWGDTYATSFNIEVSKDAKNWTSVKTVDDIGTGGNQSFSKFNNAKARYVRLKLKDSNSTDFKINEIIIHGDLIELDESVNLALKKTSQASSEYNTYTKSSLAFDGSLKNNGGDDQSRWVSQRNSNDEYIQVDLGDLYDVNRVKLYWEGKGASKYKILASRDGKEYTEVYAENNGEGGILDLQLEKSVPARFIKMQGIECASQYGYSLWEFEVYGKDYAGEAGNVNIAAMQPTAASTIDKQSIPSKAVDSNKTSGYKSLSEVNPWLNVFLKDVYTVSAAKINFVANGVNKYAIETSMTGEEWKIIKEITVDDVLLPAFVTFDEVDTRYVRISVLDDTNRILEVKDFAVYGKLSEKIEDINIAAFKTSSASTEYDNGKGFTHESKYAFDESIEDKGQSYQSRWVSQRKSNDEWVQVNLGDYYDVSKIVLNWEGAYAKEYKLQVSIDGENWNDISDVKTGMAGVKQFYYKDKARAKYVRMQGIVPAGDFGYSLWEFEVYGLSIRTQLKALYDQNVNIDLSTYTPNSVSVLKNALEDAIKVYQNDEASLKDITDAMQKVNDAKSGLAKKADKANLITLVSQVNQMDKTKYTADSYQLVVDAKDKAQAIIDDANVTNAQVVQAYSDLKAAIDALVKLPGIEIETTVPTEKDKVVSNSKDGIVVVGQLPKDIKLSTKVFNQSEVNEIMKKINKMNPDFLKTATLEKVIDLDLLLNNVKYNFDGTVKVFIKIDRAFKGKNLGIIYIDEQGNVVKLKSVRDDDNIVADFSHMSTYAIVSYDDINDEGVSENGKVEVPKTSDDNQIMIYVTMVTLAGAAYILMKKKKHN